MAIAKLFYVTSKRNTVSLLNSVKKIVRTVQNFFQGTKVVFYSPSVGKD